MRKFALPLSLLGAMLVILVPGTPAQAQATRTWVSGVGDDANPCSRTAPCKTFAGAISKTAAGGEIDALDPGGFGALTITKSISIINEGGVGGVLVAGTNGIVVAAGASDNVTIRGLDFDGLQAGANGGLSGIRFISGGALHVEKCLIYGFQIGIDFEPSAASQLSVSDTVVRDNSQQGIVIRPTGTGTAAAVLERVQAINNLTGISASSANSSGAGTVVNVAVRDSVASSNHNFGFVARAIAGGPVASVTLDRVAATSNGTGIEADGSSGGIALSNAQVSGNGTGLSSVNGGVLASYQNNDVIANGTDGAPTVTIPPK